MGDPLVPRLSCTRLRRAKIDEVFSGTPGQKRQ